ncbi:hypothetical protein CDAR_127621 [Caerostris darwini]|uniref:Uncharacterized protein n=1 Tax=Caerostris darwini TaxID=1538125 RepID=A0AAV4UVB6_9ARAC|nr:hypothetical protein CDAR_127621 [Caerostris darwini]
MSSSTLIMRFHMLSIVLSNASPIRDEILMVDVKEWILSKNREFFVRGIDRLPSKWEAVIEGSPLHSSAISCSGPSPLPTEGSGRGQANFSPWIIDDERDTKEVCGGGGGGVDELLGGRDHPVIKPKRGVGSFERVHQLVTFSRATQRYRIIGGGRFEPYTKEREAWVTPRGMAPGERGRGRLMKRRAFCRTKDCRRVLFGGDEKKLDF